MQLEKKNSLVAEITKLNIHKLNELLDVVEIVLGFLASAGGNPNQRFHNYITKTLTMQRAHIPKVLYIIFILHPLASKHFTHNIRM